MLPSQRFFISFIELNLLLTRFLRRCIDFYRLTAQSFPFGPVIQTGTTFRYTPFRLEQCLYYTYIRRYVYIVAPRTGKIIKN